jgi:microsomal dipeptidase-like Zn-dependent dipeptidase
MASGNWRQGDLKPFPWHYAKEIETPAGMRSLTSALLEAGFSRSEVAGIMGKNWLRVFTSVWKNQPMTPAPRAVHV